jgi:hypothetical protein
VVFEFTGQVAAVTPAFASIVEVGDPASGRFRYDTDAVDMDPDPTVGQYVGGSFVLSIGSYTTALAASRVFVYNDFLGTTDGFQVSGVVDGADPVGDLPLAQADFELYAASTTLFTSDALPTALPPLDAPGLNQRDVRIGIIPPGMGANYQYAVLTSVPEAQSGTAGAGAAAALAALHGRRRRPRAGA